VESRLSLKERLIFRKSVIDKLESNHMGDSKGDDEKNGKIKEIEFMKEFSMGNKLRPNEIDIKPGIKIKSMWGTKEGDERPKLKNKMSITDFNS